MDTLEYNIEDISGVIKAVIESGGEFRLLPRGTSMLPYIREGRDSVALAKPKRGVKKHDIILYRRYNGKYVLHRVVGVNKDGYIMCGDNQTVFEPEIREEQIIGVVAAVYRGDKRIEPTCLSSRIYSTIWCFMPLRKALLLAVRAVLK